MKADGAEVPFDLWNARLLPGLTQEQKAPILDTLWLFAIQWC
jgi:hypothetical protein